MARRRLKENTIRKLIKLGQSRAVTIPREFLNELKWKEKQKVVVKKVGKRLIIEDWPVRKKQVKVRKK